MTTDPHHSASSELHKRLYAHRDAQHPGKVFYLLVCRVCLGHPVRTKHAAPASPNMDGSGSVFASSSANELVAVPGVTPAVHYHSLIAETGGTIARFREFLVYHSEYIYPGDGTRVRIFVLAFA